MAAGLRPRKPPDFIDPDEIQGIPNEKLMSDLLKLCAPLMKLEDERQPHPWLDPSLSPLEAGKQCFRAFKSGQLSQPEAHETLKMLENQANAQERQEFMAFIRKHDNG